VVKSDLMDEAPAGWKREGLRFAFSKVRLIFFKRGGEDGAVRATIKKVLLQDKRPVLIFSEGTSQRGGPPMAMYPGAVEIARECGVPIQPICLRYNMPIGLDKKDDAMQNAFQVIRLAGKKLGVHVLPLMDSASSTIEDVRARITEAWSAMGPALGVVSKEDVGQVTN
jgi:1-acyl-sn-glycerol-3-phosphate acyltransferase